MRLYCILLLLKVNYRKKSPSSSVENVDISKGVLNALLNVLQGLLGMHVCFTVSA